MNQNNLLVCHFCSRYPRMRISNFKRISRYLNCQCRVSIKLPITQIDIQHLYFTERKCSLSNLPIEHHCLDCNEDMCLFCCGKHLKHELRSLQYFYKKNAQSLEQMLCYE